MANVINKTTMEVRYSVNTPDFPETEWVISPDLSLLSDEKNAPSVISPGIKQLTSR